MCILQNKTKCKGETEFWRSWIEKLDISVDRAWRVVENNGVIFPSYHVTPRVMVIKTLKKCSCFVFFANDSKILVKHLSAPEGSFWVISENGMANWFWSYCSWVIEGRNIKKLLSQQNIMNIYIFKGWYIANGSVAYSERAK